jgi:hypothetical protein
VYVVTLSTYRVSTTRVHDTHSAAAGWKTIDQERDVTHTTQTPTSPNGGEFQKARIRMSLNS